MNAPYRTLGKSAADEFIVNKSRFIGCAAPAQTEEEALAFIQQLRELYRDATHHCYAYVIGRNAGIMRYSDDGEPGGTAGLPMMRVLKSQQLVNCCVVSVRYFGGVLLGAGGLVRAYTQSCSDAVSAAGSVWMQPSLELYCSVTYPVWNRVQYGLRSLPVQQLESSFTDKVDFTLLTREQDEESVLHELTRMTDGKLDAIAGGVSWRAWPDVEASGT